MRFDERILRLAVLAAWSGFLIWLWLSGEVVRYLGPRTEWVAPLGGLALAATTLVYAWRSRRAAARPLTAGAVGGAAAMLLPLAVAGLIGDATLGSHAASKRLAARGVDVAALADLEQGEARRGSFAAIAAAGDEPGEAGRRAVTPGDRVRIVGFVSALPDEAGGAFELSRFYINCCVADAIPISIPVDPAAVAAGPGALDEWVEVTGTIARFGDRYGIRAQRLTAVGQPARPYLGL